MSKSHVAPLPGMTAFKETFEPHRTLLVGTGGIALDEFLEHPVEQWVKPG